MSKTIKPNNEFINTNQGNSLDNDVTRKISHICSSDANLTKYLDDVTTTETSQPMASSNSQSSLALNLTSKKSPLSEDISQSKARMSLLTPVSPLKDKLVEIYSKIFYYIYIFYIICL